VSVCRVTRRDTSLVAACAVALLAAPAASATTSYLDAVADSGSATDITRVRVSDDAQGRITFSVDVSDGGEQPRDGVVLLLVDADANRLTGDPRAFGADYAFQLLGSERAAAFARWNGTSYATIRGSSFTASYDGGPGISVDKRDLGNPTHSFSFWIRAAEGDGGEGRRDDAPDDGTWRYGLTGGLEPAPLKLSVVQVATTPMRPVAGRPFTLVMTVKRSDGEDVLGLMECEARHGRETLETRSTLWRNRVRCRVLVPNEMVRRPLTMRVAIRSEHAVLARVFRFRLPR
jgi:hypothetical protein